jgi:uncharacterized membrane protein
VGKVKIINIKKYRVMKTNTIAITAISVTCFLAACSKSDNTTGGTGGGGGAASCSNVAAKFAANVAPIISANCATSGCHNSTGAGGLVLQNHAQISAARNRIKTRVIDDKTMPPSGPLPPAQINILKCWIEAGAPND